MKFPSVKNPKGLNPKVTFLVVCVCTLLGTLLLAHTWKVPYSYMEHTDTQGTQISDPEMVIPRLESGAVEFAQDGGDGLQDVTRNVTETGGPQDIPITNISVQGTSEVNNDSMQGDRTQGIDNKIISGQEDTGPKPSEEQHTSVTRVIANISAPVTPEQNITKDFTSSVTQVSVNETSASSGNQTSKSDTPANVPSAKPDQNVNVSLPRANVLMIITDDMRPEIGVYGGEDRPWLYQHMYTPHLDKLASQSLLFKRAYCQQPLCNPSRVALLTSRRPDSTGVTTNFQAFRGSAPKVKTLPQVFREQGYVTMAMGKIFHPLGTCDDQNSWTVPCYLPHKVMEETSMGGWKAVTPELRKGRRLTDEQTIDFAEKNLERLAIGARNRTKPFFVALGLKKPHVPFDFPAEFMGHYPAENVSLPVNKVLPKNIPHVAYSHKHKRTQKKNFHPESDPLHNMPDEEIFNMRRAYYATISYVDSLVGMILKKLEDLDLTKDTIVAFLSDHGVHLGEHGIFGKKTNFEINAQVPLIIHVPGVTNKGLVTEKLVELVDLFPTFIDLVGLQPLQLCPESESKSVPLCTEGTSLVPLFKNPNESKWKDRIFYQYPNDLSPRAVCMGHSILNRTHRYTEWVNVDMTGKRNFCGEELYDLKLDPRETVNRANDTEYKVTRDELNAKLQLGWRAAIPK